MIGSKFSRHFFNQSEAKPKPIVARTFTFSRALCRLRVITSSFDWFTGLSPSFLIGQSNYFWFWFYDTRLKLALPYTEFHLPHVFVHNIKQAIDFVFGVFMTGMTPLHLAAWSGKVEVTRLLLEAGANVNASSDNGDTPLILACQHGNSDVVCENKC